MILLFCELQVSCPALGMPARTSTASTPALEKKKRRKKNRPTLVSLDELEQVRITAVKVHGGSKKTADNYASYLKRGRLFLGQMVGEMCQSGSERREPYMDLDKLAKAFDNPPNEYSAMVLEKFIVEKCLHENLGKSTYDGIHAAFKRLWDNM